MRIPQLRRDQGGFTLIEVLVAGLILVLGVLGTVALIDGANATTARTKQREAATSTMRDLLEAAHAIKYNELTSNTLLAGLAAQEGLGDTGGLGNGYQLERRGTVYTITGTVCSMDDPNDGLGTHDGTAYCSSGSGTQDRNPDDYKRVTLTMTWGGGGNLRTLVQTTIVNNPGAAIGPRITAFNLVAPTNDAPIVPGACGPQPEACTARFTLTTSFQPAALSWYVDGTKTGDLAVGGTSYTFDWPISTVPDGTYQVSAQGFDSNSVAGPVRVVTVKVNRSAPAQVQNVLAGRNGAIVDIEWTPNSERDLLGYRVYRVQGGTDVLVCDLVKATSCVDAAPPADDVLSYKVAGVDLDPANVERNGAFSDVVEVTKTNLAPNPPSDLQASSGPSGTTLVWTAPSPADPNDGDTIAYYRIYRDGTTIAHRYDRTGSGATLTYLDSDTGGATHEYWITAVDNHLAESPLLGPVIR